MRVGTVLMILTLAALVAFGSGGVRTVAPQSRRVDTLTILFTGDDRGWIVPAG